MRIVESESFGALLDFVSHIPRAAISWINAVTDSSSRAAGQAWLTTAAFGGQVAAAVVSAGVGALGLRGQPSAFVCAGLVAAAFGIDSLYGGRPGAVSPADRSIA